MTAGAARPWLLLPIETKAREFDGKLLQAAVAAERGWNVALGDQNAMLHQLRWLPRGAYLDKSVSGNKVAHFRRLHALGHRITAWCEEGLIYPDRDIYLRERVDRDALALTERFFCWGGVQHRDLLAKAPEADNRLIDTGNPRFDLLRPGLRELFRPEAERLRRRYGDFILVNTNFGRVNHGLGEGFHIHALETRGAIRSEADRKLFLDRQAYVAEIYERFRAVLPALSRAFPDRRIVLRPHPSEDHDRWRADCRGLPNVDVVFEGAISPWLLAAAAMVHCNCTTGVEGFLLDRPVIAYRPVQHPVYDAPLPNAVSRPAWDMDELVGLAGAALAGDALHSTEAQAAARSYIASYEGALAADRVAGALDELAVRPERHRPAAAARLAHAAWRAAQPAKALARRLLRGRDVAYTRRKFPGLAAAEVADGIARLSRLTGRFDRVAVAPLAKDCYLVAEG